MTQAPQAPQAPGNGPGTNTGHGYVWPRPDGVRARCGGPALCKECAIDATRYKTVIVDVGAPQAPGEMTKETQMTLTDAQIKHMVDRFLSWKLPENFAPDCGIQFDADGAKELDPRNSRYEPSGTNLLDATQADAMVRHMLEGLPPSTRDAARDAEVRRKALEEAAQVAMDRSLTCQDAVKMYKARDDGSERAKYLWMSENCAAREADHIERTIRALSTDQHKGDEGHG